MPEKLPGFADFSKFQSILADNPDAVITEPQMQFLIQQTIQKHPNIFIEKDLQSNQKNLPMQYLTLNFAKNATA